jgi:predicted ATPase
MPYISEIKLNKPVSEDSYLFYLPVIQYLIEKKSIPFTQDVTFFVGENGAGKSTLYSATKRFTTLRQRGIHGLLYQ